MNEPAIRAEALGRTFGEVSAVDGIDLDIHTGEIYGFLGPNGAGKSTTVRMLCTLLAPTAGTAVVAGFDVATQPGDVRLRIGVALQEAALDPKQTGAELLRLQGLLYGSTAMLRAWPTAVRGVDGVLEVEVHGNELVVTTDAGSATISPVAVALANCEVPVRDLTLRTPTLDDVFLELTGSRIEHDESDETEERS
jgi:ABC-type sugar transport system ATPase subunit